jgi:acyl carrier protein
MGTKIICECEVIWAIEYIADEPVERETRLVEDLWFDEFDRLVLTLHLEEEFGVMISDADAAKFVTIGDVLAYVTKGESN